MVKRYKTSESWPWLKESGDGGIVMYDDYAELRALCEELAGDINIIATTPPYAIHLAVVMNKTAKNALAEYDQLRRDNEY